MIVIGAGAIGIEFAYFFNAFGTKVTVVEMLPNAAAGRGHRGFADAGKIVREAGDHDSDRRQNDQDRGDRQRRPDHRRRREGRGESARSRRVPRGHRRRAGAARRREDRADRPRLHQDQRPLRNQHPRRVRRRRHHRAALARARRQLRSDPGRRRHVRSGRKPKKVTHLPRLHLLPAAGCQRRSHRTRREGKGAQVQGRQVPVHGQRQSTRHRRESKVS